MLIVGWTVGIMFSLEATLWLASVFKSNSAVADEDLLAASYFFNIVQIFSLCYLFESTILVVGKDERPI